jgi:prepilin-type processing-associated H-X9-DG protein
MKTHKSNSGFTMTELLVLVALGGILATLLLPNLDQARAKLLQQACAANMKQWGMAIDMYSQDYRGAIYYSGPSGVEWDDVNSPYGRYLCNGTNSVGIMRMMRICPARAAVRSQQDVINNSAGLYYSYTIPIGRYRRGLAYSDADSPSSTNPYYDSNTGTYWPNLKSVPKPSKYLLMIEGKGNTIRCGSTSLHDAVTQTHSGAPGDLVPAINRHLSLVNCLFGDFHVEPLTIQQIDAMDGNCTSISSPNYAFALN